MQNFNKRLILILLGLLALGYLGFKLLKPDDGYSGVVSSNGRIEAVEIDIATKTAGRLAEIHVQEGDFVTAGQVLAVMDTDALQAQLREAEADLKRAQTLVVSAQSNVEQRQNEKLADEALIEQREAELVYAEKKLARSQSLLKTSAVSEEEVDSNLAALASAKAALNRSKADVAASQAAISTAESDVIAAESQVIAAQAKVDRLKVDIKDCTLVSPRDGRVQFKVAQPGEVLNAGGRVINLIDLTDVYMTFFLPTADAGRVKIGSDVRLKLDVAPKYVIPAKATFVADVAQFTPKTVETADEREKLMFRIKAHIDPKILQKYITSVKTGLPGVAYVLLDDSQGWPESLQVILPE